MAWEAQAAEPAVVNFCGNLEKGLLLVDAGALILSEKKEGYSPNPHVNAFVNHRWHMCHRSVI